MAKLALFDPVTFSGLCSLDLGFSALSGALRPVCGADCSPETAVEADTAVKVAASNITGSAEFVKMGSPRKRIYCASTV